ncbi:hypothetical protein EG68_11490 [Paragonimus skrjabini miyazakii]|uniref:Uncharacterized protein n=1 Tax=Paragonimus skrjabini miyazakii TaxID=59628 RepID=A0A8S9YFG1_9TREM|nr:hypothetical protein EG68_11490 [Paragonimus skrjabini miyazakii]
MPDVKSVANVMTRVLITGELSSAKPASRAFQKGPTGKSMRMRRLRSIANDVQLHSWLGVLTSFTWNVDKITFALVNP